MHLLLGAVDSDSFLLDELRRDFPNGKHQRIAAGLVETDAEFQAVAPQTLVFAKQLLLDATRHEAPSIAGWSQRVMAVAGALPENQPWQLHIVPHFGAESAGRNRCRLILEALREYLQRRRRHLLRALENEPKPFTPVCSLVQ